MSAHTAEKDAGPIFVLTSVNGEQMRGVRASQDGTLGYCNVEDGPGYHFWGDLYVAAAEPECDHDWDRYWDGSLGYRATDSCRKCHAYRPTPTAVTPPAPTQGTEHHPDHQGDATT